MAMNESARARIFRIKKLAEIIDSQRSERVGIVSPLVLDAFALARLVLEGLNKEGIPDEAPGSELAELDDRLKELESRLREEMNAAACEMVDSSERTLAAYVDEQVTKLEKQLSAEIRGYHESWVRRACEVEKDIADCHAKKLAEVRAFCKEAMEEAKATETDPLDKNPDEFEEWRSKSGVLYRIIGGRWNDGYPNCHTRRELIAKGWTRVEAAAKDEP